MFEEMVYLKEKVDAGAAFVITQMFLDAQVFLDFVQDGIDRIFIDATFQLYVPSISARSVHQRERSAASTRSMSQSCLASCA